MAKFLVPENIPPHKAWDFLNNIRYTHRLLKNECSQQVHFYTRSLPTGYILSTKKSSKSFYITPPKIQPLCTLYIHSGRLRSPSGTRWATSPRRPPPRRGANLPTPTRRLTSRRLQLQVLYTRCPHTTSSSPTLQ
jgi:hypothetical protein